MNERYQLLSKEVEYIIKFISNWEVFDFDNLQRVLNEMKEIQQKMRTLDVMNNKTNDKT